MTTFVIVGGGLAGAKAAETLRAEGFDGAVVLLGAEGERPYERPPLSKGYLQGAKQRDEAFVHDRGWYAAHDVDLRLHAPVVELDVHSRGVLLAAGEVIAYDRLLLATGSAPRHVDVPGAHGDHVVTLRTLPDADRLREVLAAGGPLVTVGAGWIGLEVAAAARAAGVPVTVVESAELPLLRVLGRTVAAMFADVHRDEGVDLRLGSGIAEIRPDAVVTADGDVVPAAAVLVGVGVAPVTTLAEQAGLHVDDGIVVDEALRTSVPDVYAAGDVARAYHPRYRRHLRTEHWANALNGGPVAARSMLDQQVAHDRLPYFFTDQYDLGMEYVGWADAASADVVLRGRLDGAERQLQAFWLVDGVVEAAMHVNRWDEGVEPLQALVGLQRPVDRARLADPSVPLADL